MGAYIHTHPQHTPNTEHNKKTREMKEIFPHRFRIKKEKMNFFLKERKKNGFIIYF